MLIKQAVLVSSVSSTRLSFARHFFLQELSVCSGNKKLRVDHGKDSSLDTCLPVIFSLFISLSFQQSMEEFVDRDCCFQTIDQEKAIKSSLPKYNCRCHKKC